MLARIILVFCICFTTVSHAEVNSSPDVTPSVFNTDDELAKISSTCLLPPEHEELMGHLFKWEYSRILSGGMIEYANLLIGLPELRSALGFAPHGNWTKYRSRPSEEELAAAPTVEAYLNLVEPNLKTLSLDSDYFYERNFTPMITFLNKRFPAIRKIYQHKLQKALLARSDNGLKKIDKETVDAMFVEFYAILPKVYEALRRMNSNSDCVFE